jgi:hypothetical protein
MYILCTKDYVWTTPQHPTQESGGELCAYTYTAVAIIHGL